MTDDIKNKSKLKNKFYRQYIRHQRQISGLLKIKNLRNEINSFITKSKEKYYQRINTKLNDPSLSNKTYWSTLKTFFNGKKAPIILPLFINNKFVTDFQEKANVFNSFSQNNNRRFQAVVSCQRKCDIRQNTIFILSVSIRPML